MQTHAPKILAIDDDPDFLEFIRIILEAQGYDVVWAYNAEQGLALMRTEQPDLVLLDLLISYAMQGLDIRREMGQDEELRQIPLIVVSSVLTEASGLQNGDERAPPILACLSKPIEPGELLRLIAEVVPPPGE